MHFFDPQNARPVFRRNYWGGPYPVAPSAFTLGDGDPLDLSSWSLPSLNIDSGADIFGTGVATDDLSTNSLTSSVLSAPDLTDTTMFSGEDLLPNISLPSLSELSSGVLTDAPAGTSATNSPIGPTGAFNWGSILGDVSQLASAGITAAGQIDIANAQRSALTSQAAASAASSGALSTDLQSLLSSPLIWLLAGGVVLISMSHNKTPSAPSYSSPAPRKRKKKSS